MAGRLQIDDGFLKSEKKIQKMGSGKEAIPSQAPITLLPALSFYINHLERSPIFLAPIYLLGPISPPPSQHRRRQDVV